MLQRVRVALPKCPLGPLAPSERPPLPVPLGSKATARHAGDGQYNLWEGVRRFNQVGAKERWKEVQALENPPVEIVFLGWFVMTAGLVTVCTLAYFFWPVMLLGTLFIFACIKKMYGGRR